jgi:hypothetical protein
MTKIEYIVMQVLKQRTAHALLPRRRRRDPRQRMLFGEEPRRAFWQARFYDFNVWTTRKRVEKLRYMHRNPVKRGLVGSPDQWHWSSYRYYLLDEAGPVLVNLGWAKISFRNRAAWASAVKISYSRLHRSRPCKNRRDGAPTFVLRINEVQRSGHPPSQNLILRLHRSRPCKNRRDGAPTFVVRINEVQRPGHPPIGRPSRDMAGPNNFGASSSLRRRPFRKKLLCQPQKSGYDQKINEREWQRIKEGRQASLRPPNHEN